jgi:spore coat protein CotH
MAGPSSEVTMVTAGWWTRFAMAGALLTAGPAGVAAQSSDALFDPDVLHEVRLRVNTRDWTRLQLTYLENTHYPCELTWNGIRVPNAALRSRGAFTRSPLKPGLRLDFTRYTPDRRFLGLSTLVLDNLVQDPSTAREALALRLFARLGLPAPRVSYARLYVNGRYLGVYALVESVEDTAFLDRVLGEHEGVLYEYHWLDEWWFDYLGPDLGAYAARFEPRIRRSDAFEDLYAPVEQLVRTVNQADDESFESSVGALVQLDAVVRQAAAENAAGDIDGLAGAWGLNNIYLYRRPGARPAVTIPWDKDTTFSDAGFPADYNLERNVLLRRALQAGWRRDLYLDTLLAAADLLDAREGEPPEGPSWAEREVDRVYGLVRDALIEDPGRPYTMDEFETEVERLREVVRARPAHLRREVARLR